MDLLNARVEPEWIDYNGHMNVAYYHVAFDRATEKLLETLGLGEGYLARGGGTMFALEDRLTYRRELREGDPIRITGQLLDHDHKRMHYFMRMFHADESYLAATCEHLSTYVDFAARRSAALPEAIRRNLETLFDEHRHLERPEAMAQPIGIRR